MYLQFLLTFPQKVATETIAKLLQEQGALAALEDGQSTAAGSASATPRASVAPPGGPRLKLKLGVMSSAPTTNGSSGAD